MVASLEMLAGRGKKEYAKEAQAVATAPNDEAHPTTALRPIRRRFWSRCSQRADA